jgi:hypothetical protein
MSINRIKSYLDRVPTTATRKPATLSRDGKVNRALRALARPRVEAVGVEAELPGLYKGKTDPAFLFGGSISAKNLGKYNQFVSTAFGLAFKLHKAARSKEEVKPAP